MPCFSGKPNSFGDVRIFRKTKPVFDMFDDFYGSSQFVFCHMIRVLEKINAEYRCLCSRFRVQRLEPIDARANFHLGENNVPSFNQRLCKKKNSKNMWEEMQPFTNLSIYRH